MARKSKKKTAYQLYRKSRKKGGDKSSQLTSPQLRKKFEKEKARATGPMPTFEKWAQNYGKHQAELDRRYATYQKEYARAREKAAENGVDISPMMNKTDFEGMYAGERNQRQEQVSKGERKTTGAITRDIADAQIDWKLSQKQGKQAAAAAKEMGIDVTYKELRAGKGKAEDFWKLVKDYRNELFNQGMTKKEVGEAVSQTFFGSN